MGFLYSQIVETRKLPYPAASCYGRTVVITGSNTGLGKEAARHYARLGASRLILAVRDLQKGFAAKQDIEHTAAKNTIIDVWLLDMASYESVKAFCGRLDTELDRVDIFHANAGVIPVRFSMTEGNETTITVNFISTFLLVAMVLPKLRATAEELSVRPNLVITSSGAHKHTTFPQQREDMIFKALNDADYANGVYWKEQYPISKLLGILALRRIAGVHPADSYPVTINLVSPGLCYSELAREAQGFDRFAFQAMQALLARSTEQGSRTLIHAGLAGPESHGQYLEDCGIAELSSVFISDKGLQDRVWRDLRDELEKISPGVTRNF
ncbi:hypothetical protein BKA67DRAFT_576718 [Truncatella angustata]|uniref:Short-chain dehydrogenase/reductase n=1 Tax=Truncatella angustata TaxID=152316 RepID=A0A9P8ZUF9_9PEZI|nr:uncharacterized protein BKA67DRAFT_576718 [Truncatella angustata]KAH6649086.1 hypothetical protein BKA67DRAFT_576718 [Truncatella angustata]